MSIVKITSVFEIAKRGNPVNLFTIQEAEIELAALREAGGKMARMLKYVNDMNKQKEIDLDDDWLWAQNSDTGKKILTALAEWEAANK